MITEMTINVLDPKLGDSIAAAVLGWSEAELPHLRRRAPDQVSPVGGPKQARRPWCRPRSSTTRRSLGRMVPGRGAIVPVTEAERRPTVAETFATEPTQRAFNRWTGTTQINTMYEASRMTSFCLADEAGRSAPVRAARTRSRLTREFSRYIETLRGGPCS